MVEIIRARTKRTSKSKGLIGDIELDEKRSSPEWESPQSAYTWTSTADRGVDYDFPRMVRFMGYGFGFAPISVLPSVLWLMIVVYVVWIFRCAFPCDWIWTCFIENFCWSNYHVSNRSCCILYLYDYCRRRWSESIEAQVHGGTQTPCERP